MCMEPHLFASESFENDLRAAPYHVRQSAQDTACYVCGLLHREPSVPLFYNQLLILLASVGQLGYFQLGHSLWRSVSQPYGYLQVIFICFLYSERWGGGGGGYHVLTLTKQKKQAEEFVSWGSDFLIGLTTSWSLAGFLPKDSSPVSFSSEEPVASKPVPPLSW